MEALGHHVIELDRDSYSYDDEPTNERIRVLGGDSDLHNKARSSPQDIKIYGRKKRSFEGKRCDASGASVLYSKISDA